jgi:hypothetical protein
MIQRHDLMMSLTPLSQKLSAITDSADESKILQSLKALISIKKKIKPNSSKGEPYYLSPMRQKLKNGGCLGKLF